MFNSTVLSFDVEEHNRIEAASGVSCSDTQKKEYIARAETSTRKIVQILDEAEVKATFFVVGELALKFPRLIREIHDAGHEIASHGWDHQPAYRLSRAAFRKDITECKNVLEQIIGSPVYGYRAPTFSVMHKTVWAIDELVDAGYTYDSSIFPVHHDRYGVPKAPTKPFWCFGMSHRKCLLEIPPLTLRSGLMNLPIAGGGYFRILPLIMMKAGIWLNRDENPSVSMLYFHPWEFDAHQPKLPITGVSRWRTYVGIGRSIGRLRRILRFTSVTNFQRAIDVANHLKRSSLHEFRLDRRRRERVEPALPVAS